MPRKAPKEVIEHRITFGDYERKQLEQMIDAYQVDKVAENVPNFIIGGAATIAAVGVGVAAYALYQWLDLPPILEQAKDAAENVDRFFRPYAYDDLENTPTGPGSGAYDGSVTEFLEYTFPYTTMINKGNWQAEKPYCIQYAQTEFDSKKAKLETQLAIAQKWADTSSWTAAPLGAKLVPKIEAKLASLENRRAYVMFALENVQWTLGSNTGDSRGNTQAHVPPNQWFEQGFNWPPPPFTAKTNNPKSSDSQ